MKSSSASNSRIAAVLAMVLIAPVGPVLAGNAGGHRSKIDPALESAATLATEGTMVRVIIRRRAGETRPASVAAGDLAALASDPAVDHISLDARVSSSARIEDVAESAADANVLLATLGLPAAKLTGRGVGIAVLDSGLRPDSRLTPSAFIDFTSEHTSGRAYDDFGHGTHVSGLIAARPRTGSPWDGNDSGPRGVAPGVRLISVKVLNARGEGLTSTVIAAIDYLLANRVRFGVDVINLSLGHPVTEHPADDPLVQAVERASRAGVVVVVAAGNFGRNPEAGVTSPGNAPSAITVGALDTANTVARRDDSLAAYSSRGPGSISGVSKPDLIAPGHQLVSNAAEGSWLYDTYQERRVMDAQGRSYFRLSGTSMAAAVTSGVVALMLEQNRNDSAPPLTPNLIKAMLQFAALPLPGVDQAAQGAGALNAAGAIQLADALEDSGNSQGAWQLGSVEPFTTIADETHVWSQAVVWGVAVVWGWGLFDNSMAMSEAVVWGQAVVWGW